MSESIFIITVVGPRNGSRVRLYHRLIRAAGGRPAISRDDETSVSSKHWRRESRAMHNERARLLRGERSRRKK
jgi:hypothetical protein